MNTLTALRTFGNPGICPAKRTKIFNDRWYLVRFQNVETDPRCDYVGLAEGEYSELLPGKKAREARDARLNHCNGIKEWNGEIWTVITTEYGHWNERMIFFPSKLGAEEYVSKKQAEHNKWIADCEKAVVIYREKGQEESALSAEKVVIARKNAFEFILKQTR